MKAVSTPFPYTTLSALLALILLLPLAWPLLAPSAMEMRQFIQHLSHLSHTYPLQGYLVFELLLFIAVMLGLPIMMPFMLFAGIMYDFWIATALVTFGRMVGESVCFLIGRYFRPEKNINQEKPSGWMAKKISLKFKEDGYLYLLILRLLPLVPDTIVSYGMGATPLKWRTYLWTSLVGMIPLTLACVWFGSRLGSLSALWHYLPK